MTWTELVTMVTARTRERWSFCGYKWWSNRTSSTTSPRYKCYDSTTVTTVIVVLQQHIINTDRPPETEPRTWTWVPMLPVHHPAFNFMLSNVNPHQWNINLNQVGQHLQTDTLITPNPKPKPNPGNSGPWELKVMGTWNHRTWEHRTLGTQGPL